MVEFSKLPHSWKIIVERMPGYVFIPEADTLNTCRTKDVPCGDLVGIIECITLQTDVVITELNYIFLIV
jgi:hypothetical protein